MFLSSFMKSTMGDDWTVHGLPVIQISGHSPDDHDWSVQVPLAKLRLES